MVRQADEERRPWGFGKEHGNMDFKSCLIAEEARTHLGAAFLFLALAI